MYDLFMCPVPKMLSVENEGVFVDRMVLSMFWVFVGIQILLALIHWSHKQNSEMANSDAFSMIPERIMAEVCAAVPENAIITTDAGWNKNGVG